MASETKQWLVEVSVPVFILVAIFNLGAYIDMNSIWPEFPLLVNRLPEGWDIPSYNIFISHTCKLGLIVFVAVKTKLGDRLPEWPLVYVVILAGGAMVLMLAFSWHVTVDIGGKETSICFFVASALIATIDSAASSIFLPYMAQFKAQYISAFFIGEGLSQIIPAALSLAQGVGDDVICINSTRFVFNDSTGSNRTEAYLVAYHHPPRFSVEIYFLAISGLEVLSALSFTMLHFLPYCKRRRLPKAGVTSSDVTTAESHASIADSTVTLPTRERRLSLSDVNMKIEDEIFSVTSRNGSITSDYMQLDVETEDIKAIATQNERHQPLTNPQFAYLILLIIWSYSFMFGMVPGVQPYTCLPYGNRAYNLAVNLGLAMNSVTGFLALFLPTRSFLAFTGLIALGTGSCGYQVYMAYLSPDPLLKDSPLGESFVVRIFAAMYVCIVIPHELLIATSLSIKRIQ